MDDKIIQGIDVNFETLFRGLPSLMVVLSPEFNILEVSNNYLEATHKIREEILGKNLFTVFPSATTPGKNDADYLQLSLQYVVSKKVPHTVPLTNYDVNWSVSQDKYRPGHYWNLVNTPVLDKAGNLLYIIHEVRNITNQVKEEEQVRTSHNSLRLMAKIVGGAIWEYDILNKKFTWSESYKTLFGYSDEDLQVQPDEWTFRVHPEDIAKTNEVINKAIKGQGKSWTGEYRYQRADGTYADVLDHGYILYDIAGTPVRMLGSMIDQSKQKEYERELHESNERFKMVARATNDVVWDWNMVNNSIWWSDGFKTLFGYDENKPSFDIDAWLTHIHPSDMKDTEESIQNAIKSGDESWEFTYRFMCKDGSYKYIQDKGSIVRDEYGQAIRMLGAMIDITEKHEIELKLQESNSRTKQVLESLPLMTWTGESNGSVNYYSQSWYDYSGLSFEELRDWGWQELIHPDDVKTTVTDWKRSLETGQTFEGEARWRSRDGSYRWFLSRAVPIKNTFGTITSWVSSHTDIEEHKRAEEELVEKNLELGRINQDLDSFVYSASHDLKLPIINMAGIFDELVRSAEFHDPEAPSMIKMFNRSLKQLHETIHDLSEVVRVQKQKDDELEQINLYELTEDIKVSIYDVLKETGAVIKVDFKDAPTIPFTRASLKSIFYNLINNAIKYRDPARVPEISITSSQKSNFIELKIQDNGIGIDMSRHQNKLFQMFKRFHNHVAGSGLGLYIVNRLLNNHGGYINLESRLNEGTTFYLYFKGTTSKQ